MSAEREKMLSKIKALLDRSDTSRGSTEAEARSFLEKARELMAKHDIEEMELADLEGRPVTFDVDQTYHDSPRNRRPMDLYIARILEECFNVRVLHSTYWKPKAMHPSGRLILIGTTVDRELAKRAAKRLQDAIKNRYDRWLISHSVRHKADYETEFCRGVYHGYVNDSAEAANMAVARAKSGTQERYGLMVIDKKAAIQDWVRGKFPVISSLHRGPQKTRETFDAFVAGRSVGSTIQLADSIE